MERRGSTGDKYNRRGNIADNHFAWLAKARNQPGQAGHIGECTENMHLSFSNIFRSFFSQNCLKTAALDSSSGGPTPHEEGHLILL
jgi:hypothetical protein